MSSSRRSRWILIVTGAGVSLGFAGFALWRVTGNSVWLDFYFHGPGLILMVCLATTQTWLSFAVRSKFLPDEPLYTAWSLIAISAACDLLGAIAIQWLSSPSVLNPLSHTGWWSKETAQQLRQAGLIVGGTLRYALLLVGLLFVLRIYKKTGFLRHLAPIDWVLLALVFAYLVDETRGVAVAIFNGKKPGWYEVLGWPVDPLLFVLLIQARLLARSVEGMGDGAIGRCWKAFATGILLVWVGDLALWAVAWGHLPWQWAALGWYTWLPAAGAFAAAPAYQLEAIAQAMNEHQHPASRSARTFGQ